MSVCFRLTSDYTLKHRLLHMQLLLLVYECRSPPAHDQVSNGAVMIDT